MIIIKNILAIYIHIILNIEMYKQQMVAVSRKEKINYNCVFLWTIGNADNSKLQCKSFLSSI